MIEADWGKRLKEIRQQRGISQFELAKGIGGNQQLIHSLEKNDVPQLRQIMKICDYLQMDLWEFFMPDDSFKEKTGMTKEFHTMVNQISQLPKDIQIRFLKNMFENLDLILKTGSDLGS